MPADSIKSTNSGSNPAEPLYQVKLLAALRSGDPALIHPFLTEIGKDKQKSTGESDIDTGAAALHLAVRCGSVNTVALLLSHRAISPNGIHPPGSGTTALHLAASLDRVDIINLLLDQEGIDDTRRDIQGKTCKEVARSKEAIKAIEDSHSFLNASYRSLLRSYILSPPTSPPSHALLALLESPRVRFVDLSYLDDGSGASLLHEAAQRKDLRLIELAVRAGADVFVRNRRGKMAYEGGGKDERVKVFLRQFANANHDTTLMALPMSEPPMLKGYLNKYTNVAKGYNTRWFVLKNGVFSYYRHQEDETVASRGAISMKTAIIKTSSTDRLRFEVHSTPAKGHHTAQKWYMKASHHGEAARWVQALGKSVEWCRKDGATTDGETGRDSGVGRRKSGESDESGIGMRSVRSAYSVQGHGQGQGRTVGTPIKRSMTGVGLGRSGPGGAEWESRSLSIRGEEDSDAGPDLGVIQRPGSEEGSRGLRRDIGDDMDGDADGEDARDDSSGSGYESGALVPPHEGSFELHGNSVVAQMELTWEILRSFLSSPASPPTLSPSPTPSSDRRREGELKNALAESFTSVQGLLHEYTDMVRAREAWWRRRVERERRRQRFWEESLATVVREGETLERELRVRSRRRGSRFFDASIGGETLRQRGSHIISPAAVQEEQEGGEGEYFVAAKVAAGERKVPLRSQTRDTVTSPSSAISTNVAISPTRTSTTATSTTADTVTSPASRVPTSSRFVEEPDDDVDTDEEDEFFDAIESGTLPNLVVPEALSTVPGMLAGRGFLPGTLNVAAYVGYKELRTRLELCEERPPTSLWSVLKHSIGKDLTRISFPVFFNEPTSMLQRMAEDMEFSECLDAAAKEKDQLRRLGFVAAFAMSNYSSTIGRIAKPFNPMLSETFEYVRFDKEYRYMSEQVSHHPPISACWAESPLWHYYGEVDAQNKFMGKSFEIRPTGIAHAELILPEERGPGYPKAPGKFGEGKVVEHYSWKKVTTNVSGFILGSPTIDHYGDMVVTNHRTGDQCILTFKPRGWRGKDAYEIAGQVIDASGAVAYDIAGRWNSQLIASPASHNPSRASLNPDLTVEGSGSFTASSVQPHFLLWKNSEKPAGSPFNLTPFAITLNDCPADTLRPYLCPTDCRLRPDQRAFELGKYELANDLKGAQEEKQRGIRRAREEGRMSAHRPRWFRAETDGDTGERVWTPMRAGEALEYWVERERIWRAGGGKQWKDVDDIFIEEPESMKQ